MLNLVFIGSFIRGLTMRFDDECSSVFNSELAVKVLRTIGTSRGGDYGSSIAQSLGKSQASISRVLSNLNDIGFIKKGKREKAQYYSIDYDAIGEYWYGVIYQGMKDSDEAVRRKKWLVEGYTDREEIIEGFEQNKDKIIDKVALYSRLVFEGNSSLEDLTVAKILFQQFGLSIGHNMINNPGFLQRNPYLEYPKDALIHLFNMEGFSRELNLAVNGELQEGAVIMKNKA